MLIGESADIYVVKMKKFGYELDFSIESLFLNVDNILKNKDFFSKTIESKVLSKNACDLSVYIGESLIRNYNGTWGEWFSLDHIGANYYSMCLYVDDFSYNPSIYPFYRYDMGGEFSSNFKDHINKQFLSKINRVSLD